MAVPRASSGMLRSHVPRRAAAPSPSSSRLPITQIRTEIRGPDDLGGPGGQEAPPKSPGGPEAVRRNWAAVGGVALALGGIYAYFTTGPPDKTEGAKDKGKEGLETLSEDAKELGSEAKEGVRQVGRKSGLGGFRGE